MNEGRLSKGKILLFAALGLVVVLIAAGFAVASAKPKDRTATCPDVTECAPPAAPALVTGTVYKSSKLGFELEYPKASWDVVHQDGSSISLSVKDSALHALGAPAHSGVQIIVTYQGVPGTSARALLAAELSNYPSLALDEEPANAILSPMVGDVHGVGGLYQGTVDSPQGPSTVYAVVMAATDGTDSVELTVLTNLDRDNLGVLFLVDAIQNTFSFQSELTRFGR